MPIPFVHCHLHTEYSLLDGHSRITPLIGRAKALGMPAIAVTDHGAMYGAVEFYTKAKEAGITPIIGVEAYVAPRTLTDRDPKLDANAFHLVLLATTAEGYRNLITLTTTAHLDGFYYKPRIDKDLLARHSGGLIGLSGCLKGEATQAILRGDMSSARDVAGRYADIFGRGNFYLEIQSHGMPEQAQNIAGMRELSRALELPLIATNDVHYVDRADADAQDALMCIQMNINLDVADKPRMGGTPEFYLKSAEEMARAFGELPEALRVPLEIAERAAFDLDLGSLKLPHFPVPEGETAETYLRRLCEAGLLRKYPAAPPEARRRLDYELAIIERMGYAAYFLIVQDFVNFAKRSGILTTVRGSAAGSLVLYALNVTDVDPIAYRLPFERFLNPQRVTMPDIDVDFMDSRRDEVIRYVVDRYGADHVAQIITFGTMGARQAVRDVGRVMGLPYGDVDRIAKLIPFGASLDDAIHSEPELQRAADESAQVTRLLDLARKLEGVARHASTHAAGIIISRDPLIEHVPLQRATKNEAAAGARPADGEAGAVMPMTQYDMTAVERIGLLKMDFLGLANLTILDRAMTIIRKTRGVTIDLAAIPLDDRKTYELLAAGETVGIFQLEGAGMTRYVKELRPSGIQDIMAMVALFRPGPMANIPSYIRRKHGQEPITVLHPVLEPVLRETYGVMVYQEDVMAVAQAAAGFSSAEADVLRYAIGKKIRDKLQQQRTKFIAGCVDRAMPAGVAEQIFELFEPFARYGFNRAHAACYGLIAYYTAYLKANYPVEYMAAVLSSEAGTAEKVAAAVAEAQRMGINVLPPNVNESLETFTVVGDAIRFGLAAVKNVGLGAVESIIRARKEGGPFTSVLDLLERVDPRAVNKRVLESLIKAGALDSLGARAQMLALLDSSLDAAQRLQRERASGQTGLFDTGQARSEAAALEVEEFSKDELLQMEKEMLGMYISDHPLRQVQGQLAARVTAALSRLHELQDKTTVTVGGIITQVKRTTTKGGSAMAFITLEDLTGAAEVIIFPRMYEQVHFLLKRDSVVVVRGKVDIAEQQAKILADRLQSLEEADEVEQPGGNGTHAPETPEEPAAAPPVLHVRVDTARVGGAGLTRLHDLLGRQPGEQPVVLHLVSGGREVVLNARELRVAATVELRAELETLVGTGSVWQE